MIIYALTLNVQSSTKMIFINVQWVWGLIFRLIYVFHVLCITFVPMKLHLFSWISLCLRRHQTLALSESVKSYFAFIRRIPFLSFNHWFTLLSAAAHTQTRLNGFVLFLFCRLWWICCCRVVVVFWPIDYISTVLFFTTQKKENGAKEINIIRLLSQPKPFCFTFACLKHRNSRKQKKMARLITWLTGSGWVWVCVCVSRNRISFDVVVKTQK